MKKQLLTASAAALMTMTSVNAFAEASANVAFTTDYRYRGISQSNKDFAIQGGFDYGWDSGLYVGSWASSVDNFNGSAEAELDLYAGYGFDLSDNLSFDINALYYYYPSANTTGDNAEIDFWEFTPGITYSDDNMSATLSVSYSDDFYGETGDAFYYNTDFEFPLSDYLTLGAHVGYQTVDDIEGYLGEGGDDYADWSISLGTSMFGLDWSVAYVDTDIDTDVCPRLCDATAVGTISKSF